MVDIIHRIGIKASAARVYAAVATITGLSQWWTEEVVGSEQQGGRITFSFRTPNGELKGAMVMEVQQLSVDREVRWRCVDGPAEWIGTEIAFELSWNGDQTIVHFGHRHWREAGEFMAHCSMKWATFLLSLREYVETGRGKPSPRDLKIDDWN
jgi:uncharacterized protein YndB with AHSA1/START domain